LKWIFNAIKRDSAPEDPKLKGKPFVTKIDFVRQLSQNQELMTILGYEDSKEVTKAIRTAYSIKDGNLLWEELLDFYFLSQAEAQGNPITGDRDHYWWRRYLSLIEEESKKPDEAAKKDSPVKSLTAKRAGPSDNPFGYNYEDPDKRAFKMTDQLRILEDTRRGHVEREVEEEFKTLQKEKMAQKSLALQANPASAIVGKKKAG
jgi:hypothetical protein